MAAATMSLLTGCSSAVQTETVQASTAEETENTGETENTEEVIGLKDLADLLGMKDEETAEMFGGGEENWTADHSFYIGRIFEVGLYGENYQMYTTCGEDGTVESVALWIVSGERDVTEEEAEEWTGRITDMMGTEPINAEGVSEGGSKNRRWIADGKNVSMNQMKDILTINFQIAKGELK